MGDHQNKLVTWKQWVLALSALMFGVCLWLYREYRATGTIRGSSIAASVITFCIGLGIIVGIFWYANLPESKDKQ